MAAFFLFPGFKFSPTDEVILDYYLRRRIYDSSSKIIIHSTEPWNLPRDFVWYRNEESDIYFFTLRHPISKNSKRANRSAGQGFWDGSAKDVVIKIGSEILGHKKSLNFKMIRGGEKIKSEWIMHEYRLSNLESTSARETTFDDFVLCKIHRKKSMSNKDTIKRLREEVEEQRMMKKSRVEEDRILPVSFGLDDEVCGNFMQNSSMHQRQWNSLEKGDSSSVPNVLMPEPSILSAGDFFLQEDDLFLDEFLRDFCGSE